MQEKKKNSPPVIQRLALAHKHNVVHIALGILDEWEVAIVLGWDHVLPNNLSRRQVPQQFLGTGVTKRTGERASDLAADTLRSSRAVHWNKDRLDQSLWVLESHQQFPGSV